MNVSEALVYQECPSKWGARWWASKRPVGQLPVARTVGVALHELWATALKGELRTASVSGATFDVANERSWIEHACDVTARLYGGATPEKAIDQAVKAGVAACSAWEEFEREYPGEVLAVEQKFTERVYGVERFGRWDSIRRLSDGRVFHVQLKTASDRTDVGQYARHVQRSFHEALYGYAGSRRWGEYKGTLLVTLVKAPLHTQVKGAECACCGRKGYTRKAPSYSILPLEVDAEHIDERLSELALISASIQGEKLHLPLIYQGGKLPLERREGACLSAYGEECAYAPVCWYGASLNDETLYVTEDPLASYVDNASRKE